MTAPAIEPSPPMTAVANTLSESIGLVGALLDAS